MPIPCAPKSENNYSECKCMGKNLDRLVQPAILSILTDGDLHGYMIVQRLTASPMFGGQKPDATGVYRSLKQMEESGYVKSEWETSQSGPARRLFHLTPEGHACIGRWADTLYCYHEAVGELLAMTKVAAGR